MLFCVSSRGHLSSRSLRVHRCQPVTNGLAARFVGGRHDLDEPDRPVRLTHRLAATIRHAPLSARHPKTLRARGRSLARVRFDNDFKSFAGLDAPGGGCAAVGEASRSCPRERAGSSGLGARGPSKHDCLRPSHRGYPSKGYSLDTESERAPSNLCSLNARNRRVCSRWRPCNTRDPGGLLRILFVQDAQRGIPPSNGDCSTHPLRGPRSRSRSLNTHTAVAPAETRLIEFATREGRLNRVYPTWAKRGRPSKPCSLDTVERGQNLSRPSALEIDKPRAQPLLAQSGARLAAVATPKLWRRGKLRRES